MRQVQNNTKNPDITLLANPVGVDRVIQTLQVELSSLSWLEKSFGRSFVQMEKNPQQDRIISNDNIFFPAVYQGVDSNNVVKDFENLLVNDNLDSYCFFRTNGAEEPEDYTSHVRNRFTIEISLIFWFNLYRVDSTKKYPFQEELNQEIQEKIRDCVFTANDRVEVLRIHHNPREIFSEYSIDIVEEQNLVYPNWGYRYDMRAYYNGAC